MALSITVGGVERAPLIDSLSIGIAQGQQATCEMSFLSDDSWMPVAGQAVVVSEDSYKHYAGIVSEVDRRRRAPGLYLTIVSCIDKSAVAFRRVSPDLTYTNVTAGSIVETIRSESLDADGIDGTFIADGPTVESFETNRMGNVAEDLNRLCESTGMVWRIDFDGELRHHAVETYDAAFAVTAEDARVQNLNVKASLEQYFNRIWVRLPQELLVERVDTFDSGGRHGDIDDPVHANNGTRKLWRTSYKMHSAPVILLDDVEQTVGKYLTDTGKQFYWVEGGTEIYMDDSGAAPSSVQVLIVGPYTGINQGLVMSQNLDAQTERQGIEGGSGIYEVTHELDYAISTADAQAYADQQVALHSQLSWVASYDTNTIINASASQLQVGQRQSITRTDFGASGYYLIRKLAISTISLDGGVTKLSYNVEAARGPIVGDSVEFFRALSGQAGPVGITLGPSSPPPSNPPGAFGPDDWTIADPDAANHDFWYSAVGEPLVALRPNIINFPTNTNALVVWRRRPDDIWEQVAAASPTDAEFAFTQPMPISTEEEDWDISLCRTNDNFTEYPWEHSNFKTVTIPARQTATAPEDWSIAIAETVISGTKYGQYRIEPDEIDLEENLLLSFLGVQRRWSADDSYTNVTNWEPLFSVSRADIQAWQDEGEIAPFPLGNFGTDMWPFTTLPSYQQFRMYVETPDGTKVFSDEIKTMSTPGSPQGLNAYALSYSYGAPLSTSSLNPANYVGITFEPGTRRDRLRVAPSYIRVSLITPPSGADIIIGAEYSTNGGASWSNLLAGGGDVVIADGQRAGESTSFATGLPDLVHGTLIRPKVPSQVGSTFPGEGMWWVFEGWVQEIPE